MDAVAEDARVTKGAIYHHFVDKASLFEATFVALEERLLAGILVAVDGLDDPWGVLAAGIDCFLVACGEADFRRIGLEDAPAALGWDRWRAIEAETFLPVVHAGLLALGASSDARFDDPALAARMVLAAMGEAGFAVAGAERPEPERARARAMLLDLVAGLGRTSVPRSHRHREPGSPPGS
jgi:AcrR family transcriptional regulator